MKNVTLFSVASLTALLAFSGAAYAAQTRVSTEANVAVQTVTISAKKMSAEEKRAFDLQSPELLQNEQKLSTKSAKQNGATAPKAQVKRQARHLESQNEA